MNQAVKNLPALLPVLPVRDSVIFPRMVLPLIVDNEDSSNLIDDALKKDKMIAIAMLKDPDGEGEDSLDIHRIGTIAFTARRCKICR